MNAVATCLFGAVLVGQAQPHRRLEGLVVDPLSQPVPNAVVTAEVDGEVVATGRSDASGAFAIARLPARAFVVRAATDAPDVGACRIDLSEQRRGVVLVRTMPARRVHGVVRDAAGAPIVGAWVGCTPLGAQAFADVASHAVTDGQGRYELRRVPFGSVALRVWQPDFAGIALSIDGTTDAEHDFVMTKDDRAELSFVLVDAEPADVSRSVLSAGAQHEGVDLLVPVAQQRIKATADDGVFRVRGWPRCDRPIVRLRYEGRTVDPVMLRLDPNLPDRTKRFYLVADDDTAIVRGRLTAAAPHSVAGVRLTAIGEGVVVSCVTAADGSFSFRSPVPRGDEFRLACDDDAFVLRSAKARFADPFELRTNTLPGVRLCHIPTRPHELELCEARAIVATLRDRTGAPVAGAEVFLLGTQRVGVAAKVIGGKVMMYKQATCHGVGRADTRGVVTMTGLDIEGEPDLVLQAVGVGWGAAQTFAFEKRREELGTLELAPTGRLEGKVVGAAGQPRAGARIAVESRDGTCRDLFVACDRQGRFVITDLMPGPCRIAVVFARSSEQICQVTAGEVTKVEITR